MNKETPVGKEVNLWLENGGEENLDSGYFPPMINGKRGCELNK